MLEMQAMKKHIILIHVMVLSTICFMVGDAQASPWPGIPDPIMTWWDDPVPAVTHPA